MVFFYVNLPAQMSGEYSIGKSTSADFLSFREAVDTLLKKGVKDSVIFLVEDGTYSEQIAITPIPGASEANHIVFQSKSKDSSKVILTFSPTHDIINYTVFLAGADHITFRNMTISSGGTLFSRVIYLDFGADSNSFISNLIKGASYPITNFSYSGDVSLVYSSYGYVNNDNGNTFKNNAFINGYNALELYGNYSSDQEKGTLICGNHFTDQTNSAINLFNHSGPIISNNRIENTKKANFQGIQLYYCFHGFSVCDNRIYAPYCTRGTAFIAEGCYGTSDQNALIANNFIVVHAFDTTNSFNNPTQAIKINMSDSVLFANNSILVYGEHDKSIVLTLNGNKAFTLMNNILVNATKGISLHVSDTSLSQYQLDFNNYYSLGEKPIWLNNMRYDLDSWKKQVLKDTFSMSIDPDFTSYTDLHTFSLHLNGKGQRIPQIEFDIDGDKRDMVHPDIGADEYEELAHDLAITGMVFPSAGANCRLSEYEIIKAVFINKGSKNIDAVPVVLKISGFPETQDTIWDTISPFDTLVFTFNNSFDLSSADHFTITIQIRDSNDQNAFNDSMGVKIQNLKVVDSFPHTEDFEKGYSDLFSLSSNSNSYLWIDERAAGQGQYGMHFHGRTPNTNWTGTYNNTTESEAWIINKSFQASARSCEIDARKLSQLRISFLLRQTYSFGQKLSWFRVLVNDSIQITDLDGQNNFNPDSNKDTFRLVNFDLHDFAGTIFKLTFQSACFTFDNYYQEGDNVFIDSLVFYEPPAADVGVFNIIQPESPLCGEDSSPVILQLKNFGYATQNSIPVELHCKTPSGQYSVTDTFKKALYPNTTDTFCITKLNTSKEGIYTLSAVTKLASDTFFTRNDRLIKSLEILPKYSLPQVNGFGGKDSLDHWNTKNMWVAYQGHHGTPSFLLSNSRWIEDSTGYAFYNRKISGVNKNTHLFFEYRVVHYDYPFSGKELSPFDHIYILISPDCGRSFDTIYTIDQTNHIPTEQMKKMKFNLAAYNGQDILVGFSILSDSFNLNYFDFDSILIADLPALEDIKDTSICVYDSLQIELPLQSGMRYYWYKNDLLLIDSNKVVLHDSGTYFLEIKDSSGWQNWDSFHLDILPMPHIIGLNDTSLCIKDTLFFSASGADMFIWNRQDTGQTYTKMVSKSYFLFVEAINNYGCLTMDSFLIKVRESVSGNISGNTKVCSGDSVHLEASGGTIFIWNQVQGDSQFSFLPNQNTSISVCVADSGKCPFYDSISILVHPLPELSIQGDSIICSGDSVKLLASGAAHYRWNNSDTSALFSAKIYSDTSFYLTGTDSNSCSSTISFSVKAQALPKPNLGRDTVLCAYQSILLFPGSFDAYLWYNDSTSATLFLDSSGVGADTLFAWVKVESNSCWNNDTIRIIFDPCQGVEEYSNLGLNFEIYPNPASTVLFIKTNGHFQPSSRIDIIDLQGKTKATYFPDSVSGNFIIRLEDLQNGLYILRINIPEVGIFSKKLIISK